MTQIAIRDFKLAKEISSFTEVKEILEVTQGLDRMAINVRTAVGSTDATVLLRWGGVQA